MTAELTAAAIDKIDSLATRAAGAKDKLSIITAPAEPAHVYYTVDPSGKAERCIAEPPPRNSTLGSISEVTPFIREVLAAAKSDGRPVVYVDEDQVTVVCDDANPRDRVTVPLRLHDQFTLVQEISDKKYTQHELHRLLRIDLVEMRRDTKLLDWLSQVDFTRGMTTSGVADKSKASIGRDIQMEVMSGTKQIAPDSIDLHVRVFDDPVMLTPTSVVLHTDIDLVNQKFGLIPAPGALKHEVQQALLSICDYLQKQLNPSLKVDGETVVAKPVRVLLGKP